MTRWIDADELMKQFPCTTNCRECCLGIHGKLPCDVKDTIKDAPTVELSFCDTCKYWESELKWCYQLARFMDANDFCSEHEPKEGEEK